MKKTIRIFAFSLMMIAFAGTTDLTAQSFKATITGQVTDSTGAVVPNATVIVDSKLSNYDEREFRHASEKMFAEFPNLKAVVSTLREIHSASCHDLSAVCFCDNKIYKARDYNDIEVFDRIGSGDAFAAGFIYGCLTEKDIQYSVDCGAALGTLAMTTSGDNSTATLTEVENLIAGGSAAARR